MGLVHLLGPMGDITFVCFVLDVMWFLRALLIPGINCLFSQGNVLIPGIGRGGFVSGCGMFCFVLAKTGVPDGFPRGPISCGFFIAGVRFGPVWRPRLALIGPGEPGRLLGRLSLWGGRFLFAL